VKGEKFFMTRRPLCIAGNWKMFHTPKSSANFIFTLKKHLSDLDFTNFQEKHTLDVLLFPPYTSLGIMQHLCTSYPVSVGAQNIHQKEEGAYTGEISPGMLREIGCNYVIIGHSERRKYFFEKELLLGEKIQAALAHGITPVYCVGESEEERTEGKAFEIVERQLREALTSSVGVEEEILVAYEPVWAIGTGKHATPEDAETMAVHIRSVLTSLKTASFGETTRILYGGSVKPDNIGTFLERENVDGALIGGASLDAASFASMIQKAMEHALK
jgi:triosephosphate isomerase